METVTCPLCCEDRFSNRTLLKYHLLSLTRHIKCPFCGKVCDDIHILIAHLDKMCTNEDEQVEKNIQDVEMIVVNLDDFEEEPVNITGEYDNLVNENDEKATNVEKDAEAGVKKCLEEFMVDDPTQVAAQPSENESQEESHLYHCSECNIKFPSIQGHIHNCHKRQEVVVQVPENEFNNLTLKNMAHITEKQMPQIGSWIKWGNGYFYTNHKDMVMEHLNYMNKLDKTKSSKSISEIKEVDNEEINLNENRELKNSKINEIMTAKDYSNHYITDLCGDRYFDIPIYLLHSADDKVNDYFRVEVRKIRKLTFKKRIRLIRLSSNTYNFGIEQILFQDKPTDFKIIPILEKATECSEYAQLDNIEGCLLLSWKCIGCDVKSNHWANLTNHNCKEDKSKQKLKTKGVPIKKRRLSVSTVQSQHICLYCNDKFDSEGYLRTHLDIHANDSSICPYCDQPIASGMMETHLINHQLQNF